MPRTKGALNKSEKTEPKYIVKLTNPFDDDSVTSKTFATIAEITRFMSSKGYAICERTIAHYVTGDRPQPPFFNFSKLIIP
jgi:hypothetical protein